jgi:dienelactone hydrolase
MRPEDIGIGLSEMIFGPSPSFLGSAERLTGLGFRTEVASIYRNQEFAPPPALPYVVPFMFVTRGMVPIFGEQNKLTVLANRLNHKICVKTIADSCARLKSFGCRRIVIGGFGFGGIMALRYASDYECKDIDGVFAAYPHLVFPDGAQWSPPDLDKITVPTQLWFGSKDDKIPGTIECAKHWVEQRPEQRRCHVLSAEHGEKSVGHAFVDEFAQPGMKNPLYRPGAADRFWAGVIPFIQDGIL